MANATLTSAVPASPGTTGKPKLDHGIHPGGVIAFLLVLVAGLAYAVFSLIADMNAVHQEPLAVGAFALLGLALLIALAFEFVNGFHDTANAVATVIYTHSMPPLVAVIWSGTRTVDGVTTRDGRQMMKLAVLGATGSTGQAVVQRALALGHDVVAVSRRPSPSSDSPHLTIRMGDVRDASSLVPALAGADAVVTCIGPASNISPGDLMSVGISNALAACRQAGVKRLVMQSGITLTDGSDLRWSDRVALWPIRFDFRKAMADKALAENAVRASGLDWVIVRPVGLKPLPADDAYVAGPGAGVALLRSLDFSDCADCLIRAAATEPTWTHQVINVGR